MKILGLIPARGGSKGVPGKNIKLLGSKPLIQYSIESALESELLDAVVVSTDDENIARISVDLGAYVPWLRPIDLALDHIPTIDVIVHALLNLNDRYDAVCLLQPTCPFRKSGLIDKAISHFINQDFDSVITVRRVPHQFNPHWVFEEDESNAGLRIATGEKDIIPRRQELPHAYYRDGSIYLSRRKTLLDNKSILGQSIGYVLNEEDNAINIDTIEDWNEAENIISQNRYQDG